jgi:hypothetical protein
LIKNILKEYGLTDSQTNSILEFIEKKMYSMHHLSIRSVVKCADLMKINPDNWEELATNGLVKN